MFPIPETLIRFPLGWDPKLSLAKDKCLSNVVWQLFWSLWKPELFPASSQRESCWVSTPRVGSPLAVLYSGVSAPLLQLLGTPELTFDPNTLSISHRLTIVLKLLFGGDFTPIDKWYAELQRCKTYEERVLKIIKWVTWHSILSSIAAHWRYIKLNESHFALDQAICHFKLGCLPSSPFPLLGSRGWSQFLGFAGELPQEAWHLPCELRSINCLVPIYPIA